MAALPPVAYRRAAARSSAAGTPVISSVASGLYSGEEMNAAQVAKSSGSQRSCDELVVDEVLGDDDVREGVDDRDVGARAQLQVVVRLDVRRADEVDAPRVDHDEPGALAEPPLHPGGEDRVRLGRVRPDDDDDVAAGRPSGSPACRPRCRRSASGRSRSASGRPARRCRRCCCRRRPGPSSGRRRPLRSVQREDVIPPIAPTPWRAWIDLQPICGVGDGLVPAHHPPRVRDGLADHGGEHTLLVRRVAPGEAALHARVALVRATVLVGHHAHDLVAAQLGLERAADPAVGAGREHACGAARRGR